MPAHPPEGTAACAKRVMTGFRSLSAVLLLLAGPVRAPEEALPRMRPLTDRAFECTAERLEHGRYLAEHLLQGFICHSERDWKQPVAPPVGARKGAGAVLSERADRRIEAPNMTLDPETGAGCWTDDMLARAIREGIGHDDRPARGRYRVNVADCGGCHTSWHSSRNPGLLGGGNHIERGDRRAFSSNLTRHESGVACPVDTFHVRRRRLRRPACVTGNRPAVARPGAVAPSFPPRSRPRWPGASRGRVQRAGRRKCHLSESIADPVYRCIELTVPRRLRHGEQFELRGRREFAHADAEQP
jgi:hypothetical protein